MALDNGLGPITYKYSNEAERANSDVLLFQIEEVPVVFQTNSGVVSLRAKYIIGLCDCLC